MGRVFAAAINFQRRMAVERVVNQGGFARTGYPGDGGHQADGNIDIHRLQIVTRCALNGQLAFGVIGGPVHRHGDSFAA